MYQDNRLEIIHIFVYMDLRQEYDKVPLTFRNIQIRVPEIRI